MNAAHPLSLEVFKDAETPAVDINPVIDAMEMVRRANAGIQIVRVTRMIKIGANHHVTPETINWPSFDADINIVMTMRHIGSGDETVNTVTWPSSPVRNSAVGLVKVGETDDDIMVADTIGQLLKVEHRHTTDEILCVMSGDLRSIEQRAHSAVQDLEDFLKNGEYAPKQAEAGYCENCGSAGAEVKALSSQAMETKSSFTPHLPPRDHVELD